MNITIVSGLAQRCGMTTYAWNLCKALASTWRDQPIRVWGCIPSDIERDDVVILNYHPATLHFTMDDLYRMKEQGAKVIIIHHETERKTIEVGDGHPFAVADAIVTHEPIGIALRGHVERIKHVVIPHGIPYVPEDQLEQMLRVPVTVGTCGFAFPAKRFDVTIRAAMVIGGEHLIFMPVHPSSPDMGKQLADLGSLNGDGHVDPDFHTELEVIKNLSACVMNVYFAEEPSSAPGQSGSVRMMLAARRPMILRRCPKTAMLEPYADELYFANNEQEVYEHARQIQARRYSGGPVKVPKRVIEETGWGATGTMYRDLILEVLGMQVRRP